MLHKSPLIITLLLDKISFDFFDQRRQQYFPPKKNFLAAHLTLFHHLPPNQPQLKENLLEWSKATQPFLLSVTELKNIGKGVAYKIESPPLKKLHRAIQVQWQPWLTPQDKQKIWPHITVQNKVTPTIAKETLFALQKEFKPFAAKAEGFQLWRYENGPWDFMEEIRFNEGAYT